MIQNKEDIVRISKTKVASACSLFWHMLRTSACAMIDGDWWVVSVSSGPSRPSKSKALGSETFEVGEDLGRPSPKQSIPNWLTMVVMVHNGGVGSGILRRNHAMMWPDCKPQAAEDGACSKKLKALCCHW